MGMYPNRINGKEKKKKEKILKIFHRKTAFVYLAG